MSPALHRNLVTTALAFLAALTGVAIGARIMHRSMRHNTGPHGLIHRNITLDSKQEIALNKHRVWARGRRVGAILAGLLSIDEGHAIVDDGPDIGTRAIDRERPGHTPDAIARLPPAPREPLPLCTVEELRQVRSRQGAQH